MQRIIIFIIISILSIPLYANNHTRISAADLAPLPVNHALTLKPKPIIIKPTKTIAHPGVFKDRVVVKFKDGTKFRMATSNAATTTRAAPQRNATPANTVKRLKLDRNLNRKDQQLLRRYKLTNTQLKTDLDKVNKIVSRTETKSLSPLFSRSITALAADKALTERKLKVDAADLSNYYSIILDKNRDASSIVDELNRLPSVEIAYLAPKGEDADIAPPTRNMVASQGYLNAAPNGIDAKYAWTKRGGKGDQIKIIDIEQGWNLAHEDLRGQFYKNGVIKGGSSRQHGTAVLGVMIAKNDNHGVAGIVNRARFGVVSAIRQRSFWFIKWEEYNVAEAINVAASKLNRGDVIIIEQHAKGPGNNSGCACNCGQYRYIAMEYWQAEYDAIRAATARGITVVEAAGNGGQNLDHSRYNNKFKRSFRDSGAILVGAGNSSNRAPTCWTNYGSRVDVHGWGNNVATTGYGDIKINGNDDRQWYSTSFSGTSSASPIVAGAVAAIQGIQRQAGQTMTPRAIRKLLRDTGTAQARSSKKIGPLPNLKKAINRLRPEDCLAINPSRVEAKKVSGRWKVVQGNSWLLDFKNNRNDAIKARNIIKHYGMTKQCFVGRPNPPFKYFLKGNVSPSGRFSGEDCIAFNRASLRVVKRNNRWKITSSNSWMFDFANKKNEADASLALIHKYRFNRVCYVGRPKAEMTYLRK